MSRSTENGRFREPTKQNKTRQIQSAGRVRILGDRRAMFCFVLFCFVLYKRDRQPARMATWPMSQAPGARSRPSPRTHRAAIRPPVRGYSQFEFRRLLPARTAQSAPFRWPTVDHCALQALPGSPKGRTGTARALPVPARRDPAPVAGPPVTAVGMHTLLCPSAGSSPGLPHW